MTYTPVNLSYNHLLHENTVGMKAGKHMVHRKNSPEKCNVLYFGYAGELPEVVFGGREGTAGFGNVARFREALAA